MTTWPRMVIGTICRGMAGVGNPMAGWVTIIIRGVGSVSVFGGICRGVAGAGCPALIFGTLIGSIRFEVSPLPDSVELEPASKVAPERQGSQEWGQRARVLESGAVRGHLVSLEDFIIQVPASAAEWVAARG